jgi:UDP-N-acetylmuramyl pentapeptide phosphotransferase/UDP-N-acetylglucosamine-1-phosphate transferase
MILDLLDASVSIISSHMLRLLFFTCIVSFFLCFAVVLTKRWHASFSMDPLDGIQKFHTTLTPRIGGIPIFLALVMAWVMSTVEIQVFLGPILIAGAPAFLCGIAEDMTKHISILKRFVGTISSGLFACWITEYSLSRLDTWGVDLLMHFTFFSVVVTAFAVSGVANSINIIDGLNGYASSTCLSAFIVLALISFQVGDQILSNVSLILAACVWGFFWVNWPFGKLFLGDGGAYFLGFSLAWLAVLLIERNPSVSAFSALLICILPITEVLFSIFRRRVRNLHSAKPDGLHFHSLLHRRYISRSFVKWPNLFKNSFAGILMGLMGIVPAFIANLIYANTLYCVMTILFFILVYVTLFARMVRHHWCSPISFLFFKPAKVCQ